LYKSKYKDSFASQLKKNYMKYVITGSLGHISKPLARKLVEAGHQVTVISTSDERVKQIEAIGATAAIGSVEDVSFLTKVFRGADGVYTMIPPNFNPQNWKKYIAGIGTNYAQAIQTARVKNVVNLSSIGAHMADGCGPVSGLHFAEEALNALPATNVLHLRPGFFFYNFLALAGMAKNLGFVGGNYGENNKLVLVHTDDIAQVAANELLKLEFRGKAVLYISSDEKTTDEIASALGMAIRKPELRWVDFSDEQNLNGLVQAGLTAEVAQNYTEMGGAMRSGEMFADYKSQGITPAGKIKLKDFAPEFSAAYSN
jgi:uncharacterized protein YbjT (DUF2867 family)